jgi:hypothetical protein
MKVRTLIVALVFSAAIGLAHKDAAGQDQSVQAMLPREGLQFYFEIRSVGLTQLAQASQSFPSSRPLLEIAGKQLVASDLTAFALKNLQALAGAKLITAGYGADGSLAMIEAVDPSAAGKLRLGLQELLSGAQVDVRVRGHVVVAGRAPLVDRLLRSSEGLKLTDDQAFLKAHARFEGEPFFGWVETGSMPMPSLHSGGDLAVTPAVMAAMSNMPYAFALGGSIQGEMTSVRLLVMTTDKARGGFFSAIFSAATAGQTTASSLAPADTDLFVDLYLDWEKVIDGIQSMFEAFSKAAVTSASQGASANTQVPTIGMADVLAAAEPQLGFSLKHDLLPTLGNEVAVLFSGFGDVMTRPSRVSAGPKPAPRFAIMVALRDPQRFEELLVRLINAMSKPPSRSFARVAYRGATIHHRGDVAYTIANGFLIAGATVSEVRRVLDAGATGVSLASSKDFTSAMGSPGQSMMQLYVAGRVSEKLFESVAKGGSKNGAAPAPRGPIGMIAMPDAEGMMAELRLPTSLALRALSGIAESKPAHYGISAAPAVGAPANRASGARRTPTLTTDDVKRRP